MTTKKFAVLGCLCAVSMTLNLKADEWNKKTVFTFSAPVEIPGQVLTPGTYVFKLLDTASDRHIVQVFNKDQNHLYSTFLTIPDFRMKPADKPLISFEERAAGSPEAIKAWFYPGDNYGNEFVYPKTRAVQLAKDSGQNVPSMPTSMASNTTTATTDQNGQQVSEMKQTELKAQQPSGVEVEVMEVFLAAVPATPPPPVNQTMLLALAHDEPAELPPTASALPSLGLIGLLCLAGALALRRFAGPAA
jgi:hypothetical protein